MGGEERGQTSLDFAVGMSTLLLVFAFVLTFVPGILGPFTASGQEETITADRVADHLAEGLLAEPGTPYVLNTTCTVNFLDDTANPDCQYSGDNLSGRVGISRYGANKPYRQQINVSIVGNVSGPDGENILCWDDNSDVVFEHDETDCDESTGDVILSNGDANPPTDTGSVVAARRIVSIDEQAATLLVRVW